MTVYVWKAYDRAENSIHLGFWGPRLQPIKNIGKSGTDKDALKSKTKQEQNDKSSKTKHRYLDQVHGKAIRIITSLSRGNPYPPH
jgi:hypothetical protein